MPCQKSSAKKAVGIRRMIARMIFMVWVMREFIPDWTDCKEYFQFSAKKLPAPKVSSKSGQSRLVVPVGLRSAWSFSSEHHCLLVKIRSASGVAVLLIRAFRAGIHANSFYELVIYPRHCIWRFLRPFRVSFEAGKTGFTCLARVFVHGVFFLFLWGNFIPDCFVFLFPEIECWIEFKNGFFFFGASPNNWDCVNFFCLSAGFNFQPVIVSKTPDISEFAGWNLNRFLSCHI